MCATCLPADEGIGELVGDLTIDDETMMIASRRRHRRVWRWPSMALLSSAESYPPRPDGHRHRHVARPVRPRPPSSDCRRLRPPSLDGHRPCAWASWRRSTSSRWIPAIDHASISGCSTMACATRPRSKSSSTTTRSAFPRSATAALPPATREIATPAVSPRPPRRSRSLRGPHRAGAG